MGMSACVLGLRTAPLELAFFWQLSAQAPSSSCSEALDGGLSDKFAASWCGRACAGTWDLCCRIRACLTEESTFDVEKSLDALLQVLLSWALLDIVAGICATLLRQVEMTRKKVAATTQQPPHFHRRIFQPGIVWPGRPPVLYDVARPAFNFAFGCSPSQASATLPRNSEP